MAMLWSWLAFSVKRFENQMRPHRFINGCIQTKSTVEDAVLLLYFVTMKILNSIDICYFILAAVTTVLCQGSVIPATHTVPFGVTPTYAVQSAVPAIVTAASSQVIARNYNRLYVPSYVTPTTSTFSYPSYPTTYYKYPIYPQTYTYGYPYYPVYYYK